MVLLQANSVIGIVPKVVLYWQIRLMELSVNNPAGFPASRWGKHWEINSQMLCFLGPESESCR